MNDEDFWLGYIMGSSGGKDDDLCSAPGCGTAAAVIAAILLALYAITKIIS